MGPLLFIVYINDLDTGISTDVSKSTDDTEIGRIVESDKDAAILQEELGRLYDCAGKWQMEFNIGKCNIMSIGKKSCLV